jgi:hypothetical protein
MMSRRLAALTLAVVLSASAARGADDPKLPDPAAFDKLVVDSLRDVHNKGADLFNTSKDYVGTYRLYQGALEAVRPLLAHRPDVQKIIETGLAAAEREGNVAQKAFVLHDTIEGARKTLKTAMVQPKPETPPAKKPDETKKPDTPPAKKPDETKKPMDPVKPADKKPTDPVKPSDLPVAPPPHEGKPN